MAVLRIAKMGNPVLAQKAAPVADPTLRRERIVPRGEVASPLAVPSGCRFHPRCPFAFERCRVERPVLRSVGPRHDAACHLNDAR